MSTFILVPGGWHGGWYFQPIAETLRAQGHTAITVTLTGLGDPAGPRTAATNLDTHIQDLVSLLDTEDVHDAVLVGHSYGGMVITGAAARAGGRVRRLVYADACVPADGDSCYGLVGPAIQQQFLRGAGADGLTVAPKPGLDERAVPHPLASLVQKIRLEAPPEVEHRDYVYCSRWADPSPFTEVYERLGRDPGWHVHSLPIGHNVARDAPDELVKILIEA